MDNKLIVLLVTAGVAILRELIRDSDAQQRAETGKDHRKGCE